MNVEETTTVTRTPSAQTQSAPINASARQDIPVMACHVQVRKPDFISLARKKRVRELYFDSLEL